MDLGRAITRVRRLKKMTQAQLAQSAGVSVSHLCLVEKNKRDPSLQLVESLAKALGIPVSVLVFLAAEEVETPELEQQHFQSITDAIKGLMSNDVA